jgi:hypothetical protein
VTLVVVAVRRRGLGEEPGDPPSRLGPLVKEEAQSSSGEDSAVSSAPSA